VVAGIEIREGGIAGKKQDLEGNMVSGGDRMVEGEVRLLRWGGRGRGRLLGEEVGMLVRGGGREIEGLEGEVVTVDLSVMMGNELSLLSEKNNLMPDYFVS